MQGRKFVKYSQGLEYAFKMKRYEDAIIKFTESIMANSYSDDAFIGRG